MNSLKYIVKRSWIEVQHTDWSTIFIHEDIILKNFINKIKDWIFQSSTDHYLKWGIAESFFSWINEKFPDINKITVSETKELLKTYRFETWDTSLFDPIFFNRSLPFNVEKKKVSVRWKTYHGYSIDNWLHSSYFQEEYKSNI